MFKYIIFALAVSTTYAAPASSPEPSKLESAEKPPLLPSLTPEPSIPLAPIAASPRAAAPLPAAPLPAAPLPAAPLPVAPTSAPALEPLPLLKTVSLSPAPEVSAARSAAYARRYLLEPLRSPAPEVVLPISWPRLQYPDLVAVPGGLYTIQEYGYKINH